VAPALTSITSNFTSPRPPIQSKSACPPTSQDRAESDQDGHPGKVTREGAAGELKKGGGLPI